MLTHSFVNSHTDGPDSTKTQPSHWNAEHLFGGGSHGSLLYRDTVASNGANWIAPGTAGYALVSNGPGGIPTWAPVITPVFPLAASAGGTGIANNAASTITITGAFGLTLTLSAVTALTLPTSGSVASAAAALTARQVVLGDGGSGIRTLGSLGTSGQVLTSQGAGADPIWQGLTAGTVTHTSGALTASALVVGNGADDVKVLASLGTTTTVLHGNAAGLPTFGAVALTTDVSGVLPIANGGTALSTTPTDGQLLIGKTATNNYALTTLTAGNGLTITNGSGTITLAVAVKAYVPTIANVVNTTTETTTLSYSVPANEMADGDHIEHVISVEVDNATAGAQTPTIKFKWGATALTLNSTGWSNGGVKKHQFRIIAQRVGADLWISSMPGASNAYTGYWSDLASASSTISALVMTAPTFSSTQTVVLTIQFATADPGLYWKTLAARVYKVSQS